MFVKICGITSEEDALLAVAMGADAVGFVFAPSARQIAAGKARDIARRLPPEVLTVGVFRDESPERVVEIVQKTGLRAAQLHGHESVEHVQRVKERVPIVFKAFAAGDSAVRQARAYGVSAVLVDNPRPGSGHVFDWSLAEDVPGGLQVLTRAGQWVDVATMPESFVVNIGDLLMRWTNDRWLSNMHRVVNPPLGGAPSRPRLSIAFFNHPNYDALIECLPSQGEAKHPPVVSGEYRDLKYSKTGLAAAGASAAADRLRREAVRRPVRQP